MTAKVRSMVDDQCTHEVDTRLEYVSYQFLDARLDVRVTPDGCLKIRSNHDGPVMIEGVGSNELILRISRPAVNAH